LHEHETAQSLNRLLITLLGSEVVVISNGLTTVGAMYEGWSMQNAHGPGAYSVKEFY
jgi:hypothetical protein